ncbi:glycosyltransferase family 4 protein [Hoylesella saccharolytica]|uniref:glycosyltransferase family 4 protein n=1 Tax=Hoylesella saccharolytica TaxID=633701 RepID=UPI0028E939F6|nr:glycosyltransferase family 4 protein [Hoylesella saccharolytica]
MRILIVNTSEKNGGAAVAANRLMEALNSNGEDARMLVRDKQTDDKRVVALRRSRLHWWRFLWERWCIFLHLHLSRQRLFELDIANTGTDITTLPEFKAADIIHLSWINQAMLSLADIKKIVNSGKPVVWTMHDIWPATAICHYARGCKQFHTACHHCPLLPRGGGDNDLSARVWRKKTAVLQDKSILFVACSKWLEGQAKQSALLKNQIVTSIPNPIDTRIFCKQHKKQARRAFGLPENKQLILFVSQRVTDERKGVNYFIEALQQLVTEHPAMKQNTGVIILGGHSAEVAARLPIPAYALGYVSDAQKIASVYNSADLFVLPSLEDNLPNTIMEAMACGIPCVGYRVGGIPEEIDHLKNGYVAAYKDVNDLARGIYWVLNEAEYDVLSTQAIEKVISCYSQKAVSLRYIEVYNQALAFKKRKL